MNFYEFFNEYEEEDEDEKEYEKYEEFDNSEYFNNENLEEYESLEDNNISSSLITILIFASIWFIRIGLVIAAILFLYFIFTTQFITALIFIAGLAAAFIFGYLFMFLLDKFTED